MEYLFGLLAGYIAGILAYRNLHDTDVSQSWEDTEIVDGYYQAPRIPIKPFKGCVEVYYKGELLVRTSECICDINECQADIERCCVVSENAWNTLLDSVNELYFSVDFLKIERNPMTVVITTVDDPQNRVVEFINVLPISISDDRVILRGDRWNMILPRSVYEEG